MAKDSVIDKDALLKHIDDSMKEPFWKPVMKAAAEKCVKEITEKKDEIIKEMENAPFNVKKDQCNVTFMSLITCIHIESFKVSLTMDI